MITETELKRLRGKIGQLVAIEDMPYLTEVTRDAIRHWIIATGDHNPIYIDDVTSRLDGSNVLMAPPCILYAFSKLAIGYRGGLPGVHSMFGGSYWRWFTPVRLGDQIGSETVFSGLDELPSRFAGRMFKQSSTTQFTRQDGTRVAEVVGWGMRVERETAKQTGKYSGTKRGAYTEEDLQSISAAYEAEFARAQAIEQPRWDDVRSGDAIPSIVRGPYSATTAVAFEQAWGGLFITAHGYWYRRLKEHPSLGIKNRYGVPEPPEAVHWDGSLAQSVGVPDAYDYGPERIAWLGTMLTGWAGPEGFLEELYVEVRRFNLLGDVTYLEATVMSLAATDESASGRVTLNVSARNQRAEVTAKGWATVRLPRRGREA